MLFYYKFYKKILDIECPNLTPQAKAAIAGQLWNYIPDHLQNSFIRYFEIEKILFSNNNEQIPLNLNNEEDRTFQRMFNKYINKDAYIS